MSGAWNLIVQLYILTTVAALLAFALNFARSRMFVPASARFELKLHCLLACACMILPFIPSPLNGEFRLDPVKKTWAAGSFKEFDRTFSISAPDPAKAPAALPDKGSPPLLLFAVLALLLAPPVWQLRRLRRILRDSLPWKKSGRVTIAFSEAVGSPFSTFWGGRAWVVIPLAFSARPDHLRIAIAHEIQHHRQRDTHWLYAFFLLKAFTPLHPLRALWLRAVEQAQEEACDENLVDQGRVDRRAYTRCLLEVAEISVGGGKRVACAANFFPFPDRNNLKRRIEHMYERRKTNKLAAGALAAVIGILLTGAAFASGNWIVDHRISMEQAEKMAENARRGSEFPIVVNELVLKQLNRYLGTEQGRKYLRAGLARMQPNLAYMRERAADHRVPEELFAVGMAESNFENLPPNRPHQYGAGVWQFIVSTARVYGLRVDEETDERMDFALSTDAAFRYLKSNQLMLGDWMLAVMGYNIGERRVYEATRQHRTRDVWELLRKGVKTDPDYLPRVMAMVLILKNPESLR